MRTAGVDLSTGSVDVAETSSQLLRTFLGAGGWAPDFCTTKSVPTLNHSPRKTCSSFRPESWRVHCGPLLLVYTSPSSPP